MFKKLKITDDGCLFVVILSMLGISFILSSVYPTIELYLIWIDLVVLGLIIDRFRVRYRELRRHNIALEIINSTLNDTIRTNNGVLDIAIDFAKKSKVIAEQPLEFVQGNTALDEIITKIIGSHTEDLDYFIETLDDVKRNNVKNLNTIKSI
ncbi:MAG: hypothetical protein EKK63_17665 [Acinetobacter sp.]|uniref:hypothetical protein n=1 Tax=Acinetobacter sp. TaxID=472 RepID=UPI000FB128CC|nr:hypothetical protein [Acinetobacter sp.]RUP36347.1 MAG: hypothetical protein EKK63_17665 [Acinetobacter sp.]